MPLKKNLTILNGKNYKRLYSNSTHNDKYFFGPNNNSESLNGKLIYLSYKSFLIQNKLFEFATGIYPFFIAISIMVE